MVIEMERRRLTPTMSSRKAMVLDFVTVWLGDHPGSSPSLAMIGRGTGVSKDRAAALVRQLRRDGKLVRLESGALVLPAAIERAVRLLQDVGVVAGDEPLPPAASRLLTFSTLPMLAPAGHAASGGSGSCDGAGEAGQD